MALLGVLGNGTKVSVSNSSPTSYTQIAQLLDVNGVELTAAKVDTTIHSSSRFKSSMPGLLEVKDPTLTLLYDATAGSSHDNLWSDLLTGLTYWWKVEVPADRTQLQFITYEFQAAVGSHRHLTPIGDKQTIAVDLMTTGAIGKTGPA